ncbi:MAG: DNA polymerase III subunit gamma/tau, partial [Smithellaceae bacterium]
MEYLVLARKFRPQCFEEVVGQEHVVKTLKNAISQGRVAHAFLFAGPRGIGKTSVARILAKSLNCEKGPTPTPCGECANCKEITDGRSLDVREIDGASNRGIDEIRELRENVKFAPAASKYKVYIIDEVHMLTREAFNALLKTLEEPPAHVIFIFATTESHKVPATIMSRCQCYDFRRISLKEIIANLGKIAAAEGIQISKNALGW